MQSGEYSNIKTIWPERMEFGSRIRDAKLHNGIENKQILM